MTLHRAFHHVLRTAHKPLSLSEVPGCHRQEGVCTFTSLCAIPYAAPQESQSAGKGNEDFKWFVSKEDQLLMCKFTFYCDFRIKCITLSCLVVNKHVIVQHHNPNSQRPCQGTGPEPNVYTFFVCPMDIFCEASQVKFCLHFLCSAS